MTAVTNPTVFTSQHYAATMSDMSDTSDTEERWPLGVRIRDERLRADLTIRESARRAGISEGRWRHLEEGYEPVRGVRVPVRTTPRTIARIASVFDLPLAELLEVAGFDPDDAVEVPTGVSYRSVDVSALEPEDVEKVRSFVDFLKKQSRDT